MLALGLTLFGLSTAFVRVFYNYANKKGLLDIPNARSSHNELTPRGAGVVFVLLWALSLTLAYVKGLISIQEFMLYLPGTFLVSLCGFWDDHKALTARKRFLVQVLAATLCVAILGQVPELRILSCNPYYLGWGGLVLAVVGIVWTTNLFNFMDGLDGFAAMEALFVFGVGGTLFWLSGEPRIALLAWALTIIVGGFLVWNWPKASVFMGDVGSYCLGFLIGLFSVVGDLYYRVPLALWVILFSLFWFDATITLVRRFLNRENLATAHREHAFQRLHRAGFSQKQVLFGVIGINCVLSTITIWVSMHPIYIKWGLLFAVLMLTALYLYIEKLKPMTINKVAILYE